MVYQQGFTLVEMMIVIAIVATLAVISVPAYQRLVVRSSENACLSEAKMYGNVVFYAVAENSNGVTQPLPAPNISACQTITDASAWQRGIDKIIATPKNSTATIECDLPNGTPCKVVP